MTIGAALFTIAAGAALAHRRRAIETERGMRCVTPTCVAADRPH